MTGAESGLLGTLGDWWFSILGYGVMAAVVVETFNDTSLAARVRRKLDRVVEEVQKGRVHLAGHGIGLPPGVTAFGHDAGWSGEELDALRYDIALHEDERAEAEQRLALWIKIAPLLGLLFTAMQLAMVLPNAFELIQADPAAYFRSVGVAVGSTALGVLATILASIAAHRLEVSIAALERATKPGSA